MKKKLAIFAISSTALLTSCSSGWSCKGSYVKAEKTKSIEKIKEA
jgi:protein involved in sex pheromone biosynthesis